MDASRTSGYRIFCNEHIEDVKKKIESETGKKTKISILQKELSSMWKKLSDEEKSKYKSKAKTPSTIKNPLNTTQNLISNKKTPAFSPFQNYRIKNILSLDPNTPKFTPSAIRLINDSMALFLEHLAELTKKYVVEMGEKYPIKPEHIVGGIYQGDNSIHFLKEAIEYISKEPRNLAEEVERKAREAIRKKEEASAAKKKDNKDKITKYFHTSTN